MKRKKKYDLKCKIYSLFSNNQFVIFKTLSYCFEEITRFDVKALFARPPMSRLIKADDITKEI